MLKFEETGDLLKNIVQESDLDFDKYGVRMNFSLDDLVNILNKFSDEKIALEFNGEAISIQRTH